MITNNYSIIWCFFRSEAAEQEQKWFPQLEDLRAELRWEGELELQVVHVVQGVQGMPVEPVEPVVRWMVLYWQF